MVAFCSPNLFWLLSFFLISILSLFLINFILKRILGTHKLIRIIILIFGALVLFGGSYFLSQECSSGSWRENPNSIASDVVKDQINLRGSERIINNISFSNGDSLSAVTIALTSKVVATEHVCVFVSDSTPNLKSFVTDSAKVVRYEGSFTQKTGLFVLCDWWDNLIDSDNGSLKAYAVEERFGIGEGLDSCEAPNKLTPTTYCVIAVINEEN